jgi:hypothetical protein
MRAKEPNVRTLLSSARTFRRCHPFGTVHSIFVAEVLVIAWLFRFDGRCTQQIRLRLWAPEIINDRQTWNRVTGGNLLRRCWPRQLSAWRRERPADDTRFFCGPNRLFKPVDDAEDHNPPQAVAHDPAKSWCPCRDGVPALAATTVGPLISHWIDL